MGLSEPVRVSCWMSYLSTTHRFYKALRSKSFFSIVDSSLYHSSSPMEIALFILALIIALVWVVWSLLPVIPWVLLSWIAMLIVEFATPTEFWSTTRIIFWVLLVLSIWSDYLFPILWAKKWWGSKAWTRGSIAWLILWIFFPPWWLLVWPLLWARLWELYVKKDATHAFRAAWGSFLWSVWSTVIKLASAGIVVYRIVAARVA